MESKTIAAQLKQALESEIDTLIQQTAEAISRASYGRIIADSEEPVRDAAALFRQQLYQKALTIRQQQMEPAFSPSADSSSAGVAQQRPSENQLSND